MTETRVRTRFINAICPGCEKKHRPRLNWVGKEPAKLMCPSCRKSARRGSPVGGRELADPAETYSVALTR